ncbi:MAG: TonB family protein [Firmicutes bacterium]|nr:TonB family protein [Bacillota bacterium]
MRLNIARSKGSSEGDSLPVAILVSIAVHALLIWLIPVWEPKQVAIYPLEFGEISQTFSETRRGKPAIKHGTPAAHLQAGPQARVRVVEAKPKTGPTVDVVKTPPDVVKASPIDKVPIKEPQVKEASVRETRAEAVAAAGDVNRKAAKTAVLEDKTRVLTSEHGDEKIAVTQPLPEKPSADVKGETGGHASPGAGAAAVASAPAVQPGEGRGAANSEGGQDQGAAGVGGVDYGTGESLVVRGVPPVYPKNAQNEGIEGSVDLKVRVGPDGNVQGVDIVGSSTDERLNEVSKRTVSSAWNFRPIGKPYSVKVKVSFSGGQVKVIFGGVSVAG